MLPSEKGTHTIAKSIFSVAQSMLDKFFNLPHPGEFIVVNFKEPFGLSCRHLAAHLDVSVSTLCRRLNQQSRVSPEVVLCLSKALGRSPDSDSWLAMQDAYDLWQASRTVKLGKIRQIEFQSV